MRKPSVQESVETALESAIEALNVIATDDKLDTHLREVQKRCNDALEELRGFPHELPREEWQKDSEK